MSDTIMVALIAVAGTLGSGLLSYVAAGRGTSVQLTSLDLELQRLKQASEDAARQERLKIYTEYIQAVDELEDHLLGISGELTPETFLGGISASSSAYSRLTLLGCEEVVDAAGELIDATTHVTNVAAEFAAEEPGLSLADCFDKATDETHTDWKKARNKLRLAMRVDLERR